MNYSDILDKIQSKSYEMKIDYPVRHKQTEASIMDANLDMSVKWCRNELKRLNDKYNADIKKYHEVQSELVSQFENDMLSMIIKKTGKPNQAERIYSYGYEKGISTGYENVLCIVDELLSIITMND